MTNFAELYSLLERVEQIATPMNLRVCLVGGFVRDFLLGRESCDIDLVVEGDVTEFAKAVHAVFGGKLQIFPEFYTCKITELRKFGWIDELDFASARQEKYLSSGALPQVQLSKLEYDQKRRDFSINSIAVSIRDFLDSKSQPAPRDWLEKKIIDPFGGLVDLRKPQIRVLHNMSFIDDPTRIYRGCRYAARFGAGFERLTWELMQSAVNIGSLLNLSWFRNLRELRRILEDRNASGAFKFLIDLGGFRKLGLVTSTNGEVGDAVLLGISSLQAHPCEILYEALFYGFYHYSAQPEELFQAMAIPKKKIRQTRLTLEAIFSGEDRSDYSESAKVFRQVLLTQGVL